MTRGDVSLQLRSFATSLLEQVGGDVDWELGSDVGLAVAPEEVTRCLNQTSDTFSIATRTGHPGLVLGLGNEFVDLAGEVLQRFVPMAGSFEVRELSVKKSDYQSAVDAAFGWQNARARVRDGHIGRVPYHTWWFHVTLQSDDAWDAVVLTTLNAKSLVPIEFGDPRRWLSHSQPASPLVDSNTSLAAAIRIAEQESLRRATDYLQRTEQRLERDRKRLKDYYGALRRDAGAVNRRTKVAPSAEEIESRQRAVSLELQRKLSELEERFALVGTVRPIAMVECSVPSVAIEVEIQRKAAKRLMTVYWNGLLKRIEPLQCSVCQQSAFNLWFTNDDVLPVCGTCRR